MSISSTSESPNPIITQFRAGEYDTVIQQCEEAIATEKFHPLHLWYLGMALLLTGKTETAEIVWMDGLMGMAERDSLSDPAEAVPDLLDTLQTEIFEARSRNQHDVAWKLAQCSLEFAPDNVEITLNTLEIGLHATPEPGDAIAPTVTHLINLNPFDASIAEVDKTQCDRLLSICRQALNRDPVHPATVELAGFCIDSLPITVEQRSVFSECLYRVARAAYEQSRLSPAMAYADWSMQLEDSILDRIGDIVAILREGGAIARPRALEIAEHWFAIAPDPVTQLQALETLLALLADTAGQDQRVVNTYDRYRILLDTISTKIQSILATSDTPLSHLMEQLGNVRQLINAGSLVLYFEDAPDQFRSCRNAIAQAAQIHMEALAPNFKERHHPVQTVTRPLRIGYFASTLYRHSVGWLSRWLFKHHDRDRLDIHLYSTTPAPDFVQQALKSDYGDRFHDVPADIGAIANRIADDSIDILVELDSLTSLGNCSVMALKPAPVQVNWLGFDSSGIPAIDYFIADPYVLPEDADRYYHERIWRLPQTYIAVDGFEVHTPTLRRCDLEISDDAIVYLSSQAGLKRNPDHARLQLQILHEVPNSYFLIKSFSANPDELSAFFQPLAEDVGVASDRLRFLPDFPSEFVYRANLQLADIVLDTYPYNGATTTLEALWMGLPIVTRVGNQFAARNSYTMMVNAGITEGIAWTNDEYLEWGIRLGKDETLRRDIVWKLHQSRHTAPLWNARQFARELERAYEQMWQNALR